MTDIPRLIDAAVEQAARARHAAIEAACEAALVGGVCGVSVYDDAAIVDPDVPYGFIHYHQRPSS
jgi:hypothetical protein